MNIIERVAFDRDDIDIIARSDKINLLIPRFLSKIIGGMRLDLNLVEVFCSVYEEGSFSKAARKLRLSQPTISGHIKNLEDHIGGRLFDRLPRRIVPTSLGDLLYRRGRAILNEKEAALREIDKFLNRMEGVLSICASTIPGEYLLPALVAEFHSRFPAVNMEVRISDSEAACDQVLAGDVEIGFVGARLETIGLDFYRFASDELALVTPNDARWKDVESLTLDQLVSVPLLTREAGSGTRLAFEKRVARPLEEFNLVGSLGSTGAIKEAIKAGLGVSVVSLIAVRSELANGTLKTVNIAGIAPIRRDFFAVINKKLTLSPAAEAFLELALETSQHDALLASRS